MSKLRVTVEVDGSFLFDAIQRMQGDTAGLGNRLAGALMTGKVHWTDATALSAVYGIEVTSIEHVPDPAPRDR